MSKSTLEEGDLLTFAQALKLLPVGRTLLYDLIAAGEIPVLEIHCPGRKRPKRLIRREDLEAYIRSRMSPTVIAVPTEVDADTIAARYR